MGSSKLSGNPDCYGYYNRRRSVYCVFLRMRKGQAMPGWAIVTEVLLARMREIDILWLTGEKILHSGDL